MRLRHILLSSVSIAAVASSATVFEAKAQEAVKLPPGFQYSLEGAWLMGKNNVAEDKIGASGGVVQDNAGVRGALSAGFRIDDKWTFELGASSNQMFDSHSTLSSGGPISNTDFITNFSFQNLDFNAAFAPVLSDKFDLKLFGGIRSLHYTDTQDKMGSDSSGGGHTYQGYYTAEFIGAGPRIGVSGSARFGDSPLGVSGLLSAALIYGEERVHSSYNFTSGGSGSGTITVPSSTEWKSIYDIEASLGLDYHVNPQTMFTLGVRSEQISGVASGLAKGGPTTRLVYGPFAKVSGSF